MKTRITKQTITMISKFLRMMEDLDQISNIEKNEIIAQLRALNRTGELIPSVEPKLINQKEAAEYLGTSYASFKKLEKANIFPFSRKMIGGSVRYRNTDVIKYILADDNLE